MILISKYEKNNNYCISFNYRIEEVENWMAVGRSDLKLPQDK